MSMRKGELWKDNGKWLSEEIQNLPGKLWEHSICIPIHSSRAFYWGHCVSDQPNTKLSDFPANTWNHGLVSPHHTRQHAYTRTTQRTRTQRFNSFLSLSSVLRSLVPTHGCTTPGTAQEEVTHTHTHSLSEQAAAAAVATAGWRCVGTLTKYLRAPRAVHVEHTRACASAAHIRTRAHARADTR